ncbi:hypothetical protein GQ53DRAFT_426210 [Thozetella sp. PMI_491]|nr:hypothetical protein GQ53DRAFT_426210 [Thozetella sp. PMI_491]
MAGLPWRVWWGLDPNMRRRQVIGGVRAGHLEKRAYRWRQPLGAFRGGVGPLPWVAVGTGFRSRRKRGPLTFGWGPTLGGTFVQLRSGALNINSAVRSSNSISHSIHITSRTTPSSCCITYKALLIHSTTHADRPSRMGSLSSHCHRKLSSDYTGHIVRC